MGYGEEINSTMHRIYISYKRADKDIRISQSTADEITVWEQITNSYVHDIEHLNALIYAYAQNLLAHFTLDFMEDVE